MASQVLSGSSNVSYTNNTGQNVRIVINYMAGTGSNVTISMSWGAGGSASSIRVEAIGRNLAASYAERIYSGNSTVSSSGSLNNAVINSSSLSSQQLVSVALPTELMLAPGQTFSATCGAYNIVVIPENG